ncbi:unnamed protein product [Vicia faba]|uniref:Uncharacterized protein n=1 Tax=Vicia faba TaxID=3906 RepID=A0AAV0YZR7_VICFA|nr:unnamed protein product [Vicia faba]
MFGDDSFISLTHSIRRSYEVMDREAAWRRMWLDEIYLKSEAEIGMGSGVKNNPVTQTGVGCSKTVGGGNSGKTIALPAQPDVIVTSSECEGSDKESGDEEVLERPEDYESRERLQEKNVLQLPQKVIKECLVDIECKRRDYALFATFIINCTEGKNIKTELCGILKHSDMIDYFIIAKISSGGLCNRTERQCV